MAASIVKSQKTTLHLEISPITNLDEISSPKIYIHGIPWQIEASRNNDKNSLAVYLQCTKKDDSSLWTAPACATIKVMPFSDDKIAHIHHITPYVFNSSGASFGTSMLMHWDELLNIEYKFVQDDAIQLKIKIMAEDPNYVERSILKFETIDKSCDCGSHATFRLTISNIKNLMAVRSPPFTVRGMPWDLSVYKCQTSNLSIMLEAKESSQKVSCKMTMSVKLLSSKDDGNSIKKSDTSTVRWPGILDVEDLISWDELLKPENGYVNDHSITLEVKVKADKPDGDIAIVDHSDAAKRRRFECAVCLEGLDNQDISATECGHMFCTTCVVKAIKNRRVCPLCKGAVQLNKLRRLY